MKATIQINADGSKVVDIIDASVAELQQLISGTPARKNVVEATTEAISRPVVKSQKKAYRRSSNEEWTAADMEFMARMALQLGPTARGAGQIIAKSLYSRPDNKRTLATINSMAYNVFRYLRDGKIGTSIAKKNIADLNSRGFTASMMTVETETPNSNMLGDVRQIPVHSA